MNAYIYETTCGSCKESGSGCTGCHYNSRKSNKPNVATEDVINNKTICEAMKND